MTQCDLCNSEGNMPIIVVEHSQENILETHFCSEICLIKFFRMVNDIE